MATKLRTLPLVLIALSFCAPNVSIRPAAAASPGLDHGGIVLAQADPDAPDDPQSAAGLLLRVDKLENRIRSMTGQIEQLQYQNKRLEDELRKMQQDVDFRFQDLGRGGQPPGSPARIIPLKRGDNDLGGADAPAVATSIAPVGKPALAAPISPDADGADALNGTLPPDADTAVISAPAAAPALPKPARRGSDAFDPAADPAAPGVPKPLGTTAPSAPLTATVPTHLPSADLPHAPLDLMPGSSTAGNRPAPGLASVSPGSAAPAVAPNAAGAALPGANSIASLTPGGTRSEYEADFGLYKSGQYDAAATAFTSFLIKYPKDRLIPDATYFLGEAYARLGRHREAAEQFLKLTTDYTRSTRAPDALLRLGIALNALGAKEQACATYQEVDRKFPAASADVRAGVERELKRARC